MMTKLRPFDAGGWFPIHNAVFDLIMPRLSPNAWKVLCVAIRQTWGWMANTKGDPRERREWDRISYSQFLAKTGIKSRATISAALQECLTAGYLLRYQIGTERGQPAYVYALNRNYELEVATGSKNEPVTGTDFEPVIGSKNEPVTGTDPAPVTGSKSEPTKQRKQTANKDGGDSDSLPPAISDALKMLTDFGVERTVATRLVSACSAKDVRGWIAYARRNRKLDDPVGFVVSRLKMGESAPEERVPRASNLQRGACPKCYLYVGEDYLCDVCGKCFDCCECDDDN